MNEFACEETETVRYRKDQYIKAVWNDNGDPLTELNEKSLKEIEKILHNLELMEICCHE